MSWPAGFKGGRTIQTPVISLDILPTALEAVGLASPSEPPLDGKGLLPLLTGKTPSHHDVLYWSDGGEGEWAVRKGDWKLHANKEKRELIDLAADPAEKTDLSARHPDKVKELTALYDAWLEPMANPISGNGKRWAEAKPGEKKELTPREQKRERKRMERKKERTAEKDD